MTRHKSAETVLEIGGHRTLDERETVRQLATLLRHIEVRAGEIDPAIDHARSILHYLAAAGLPATASSTFDLTEVVNLLALAEAQRCGLGVRASGAETGRRLLCALIDQRSAATAPDLGTLPPRRFEVALDRTFHLAPGDQPRLRLPRPVEDAQLDALAIVAPAGARLLPGRIELRPSAQHGGAVTIGANFAFVARPSFRSRPAEDVALWLADVEGPIRVTTRVRALAAQLAAATPDPFAAIGMFRDHLIDAFGCGIVHYDRIGCSAATDWVLDHGWFDCRLGAALLAALCRARGIPARLIGGYLLWDAPTEHFWMEAWLPERGWLPFDLMAWGLSAGGRDRRWRNIYAGAIDYRMKTQVFPHVVTGPPGVSLRGPLHRLKRQVEGGIETSFVSADDGRLIFAETVRIVTG